MTAAPTPYDLPELSTFFADAVHKSPSAILVADAAGLIRYANPITAAMFGYAAVSDLVGKPLSALVDPADRERHTEAFAAYTPAKPSHVVGRTVVMQACRADGTTMPVEVSVHETEIAGGLTFVGIIRDMTGVVEVETALRVSEQRFQSLGQISSLALVQIDLAGNLLYANPELRRLLGLSAEESLDGVNVAEFFDEENAVTVRDQIARRATGESATYEVVLTSRSGAQQQVLISATPDRDISGQVVGSTAILVDISEQKEVEQRAERIASALQIAFPSYVRSLVAVMDAIDPYTGGHQEGVAAITRVIAIRLGMDPMQVDGLQAAALLHDVGKVGVPATILAKPGELLPEELALMRTHVQRAHDILDHVQFPWPEIAAIYEHHERLDGSGYPLGLRGDEISMAGCILAVADVVDAMASHRPYRPAGPMLACLQELRTNAGTLYHPQVAEAALESIEAAELPHFSART